jgi:hypothetical protein
MARTNLVESHLNEQGVCAAIAKGTSYVSLTGEILEQGDAPGPEQTYFAVTHRDFNDGTPADAASCGARSISTSSKCDSPF